MGEGGVGGREEEEKLDPTGHPDFSFLPPLSVGQLGASTSGSGTF